MECEVGERKNSDRRRCETSGGGQFLQQRGLESYTLATSRIRWIVWSANPMPSKQLTYSNANFGRARVGVGLPSCVFESSPSPEFEVVLDSYRCKARSAIRLTIQKISLQ